MTDDIRKLNATRRAVLGGAAAAGAAAAMGPTILGGSKAQASEPQRGGTLRMGIGHGSTTDSLDPATYENGFSSGMGMGGLFNYITAVDETNQLEPELAEDWSASADAATWTFKIRKGVTFHNGKDVTPDDIVANLNYHRGEDSISAVSSLFEQVDDIRVDGDSVVISLNAGNADYPYSLSDYHLGIQPSDGEGNIADPASGIGAGSYMLVDYEPGIEATLERNPNYWKDDRGWFDEVIMTTIADPSARQNALMSGQVDVIDRVDTKTAHLLEQHPAVELVETTGTLHYTMPMRTDMAPFDDNNVRMALKYAIDRDEIIDKILRGYGVAGQDSPITPANRFFADDIEHAAYDPDKARWYLQQSDLDGLQVDLSTSEAAFVGAVDAAVLYKEHAAAAGIDINVIRETPDGYWSDVWMQKAWCTCYWGGRPTEDWMFSMAYSADAPWNDSFWHHDRFNELLLQARSELDQDLRREMYREMQEIVATEGGVLVAAYANNVDAASTALGHGPNVGGNWGMDGARLMERWWFNDTSA
ncbi:MAG: peptide ABC transporter substrate-binding protein [Rhodospirillaceae bacterium]|nr:peptide ABC transporter substrate-binding protein [Rhodospirillaceae bacterium]|tara:strand:- start:2631 stop:4226 length:1596 start_codon:yes stop_codon:yes gene_type:complete